jgi:hypothetical protein
MADEGCAPRRRDITDVALDFSTADVEGIEIVLSQRQTTVSGTITTSRGAATADASVVLFVDDPDRWGPNSRFIGSARPDQQGRYTITGLPPARYLAVALEYLEPGQERDPDALAEWRRSAEAVTLAEGESLTLDLTVSSP